MKTRVLGLTLLLGSLAVAVCLAADANMGTWKLNEAKSKLNPNGPKNHTVVYAAAGDSVSWRPERPRIGTSSPLPS